MAYLVLKARHSLIGKGLLPMILEFNTSDSPDAPIDLARLKKAHALQKYSLEELSLEFIKLNVENLKDVMMLTGKDLNFANAQKLMHQNLLFANQIPHQADQEPSYSFWTESSKDICITGVTLIAQSTMKSYKTFDYKTTQSLIANEERRLKAVERLIVEKQRLTFAMESERLAIERQRFYIEQQEQQLYMAQMNINFAQMGVRLIEQQTLNIPDDI